MTKSNPSGRRMPVYHIGIPRGPVQNAPIGAFREDLIPDEPPQRFALYDLSSYQPEEADYLAEHGACADDAIAYGLEYPDTALVAFRDLWTGEWEPSAHRDAEAAREHYSRWGE